MKKITLKILSFTGMGWGSYTFKIPILGRILNKLSFLRKAFAPKFSTYNGKVNSKLDTLKDLSTVLLTKMLVIFLIHYRKGF
ncbi:MAG: hypothetical protein R3A80_06245 [Bdellovibrionota bacterium]